MAPWLTSKPEHSKEMNNQADMEGGVQNQLI